MGIDSHDEITRLPRSSRCNVLNARINTLQPFKMFLRSESVLLTLGATDTRYSITQDRHFGEVCVLQVDKLRGFPPVCMHPRLPRLPRIHMQDVLSIPWIMARQPVQATRCDVVYILSVPISY